MDSETRIALSGMADEVLDVAERLVSVGEDLNKLLRTDTEVADKDAWMAGAKRELAEMIRRRRGRLSVTYEERGAPCC